MPSILKWLWNCYGAKDDLHLLFLQLLLWECLDNRYVPHCMIMSFGYLNQGLSACLESNITTELPHWPMCDLYGNDVHIFN